MKSLELVSIIIPVKERSELLFQTLKNICNQTYTNIEVIVIDDNSRENIKDVIQDVSDKRVRYLKSNGTGPGAARNIGFKHANGEFVKFFDSDDLMSHGLIEDQVKKLTNNKGDAVFSPYVKVRKNGNMFIQIDEIMHYRPWIRLRELDDLMLVGFFIPIPAFLFKRSFLNKAPDWPTGFITYEDWYYLWNLAALKPKLIHSNSDCFFYIIHGEQSTGMNLTDAQRDEEKSRLMLPLLIQKYQSKSSSFLDVLRSGARLLNELKGLSAESLKEEHIRLLKSKRLRLVNLVWRAYQKIGILTRASKWPRYYGAIWSSKIFNHYVKRIR